MPVEPSPQHGLNADQSHLLAAAGVRLRGGDFAAAAELAGRLCRQAPHAADAWHVWALALAQLGHHEAACEPFRRALDLNPENPHLLANFATALRRMGRRNEALELWRQAVAIAPGFGQAWLDLGLTELELEHFDRATDALQKAVQATPASAPAWHGLGNALDAQDHPDRAERAFRNALECDAGQSATWINLGHLLRRQARVGEALDCYGQARRIGGDVPELLDAQAGTLLDAGRVDEAIATAQRLTATWPRFAPGQQTLAQILWEYGAEAGAAPAPLASFATAVAAYPDDAQLRFGYAQMLKHTGQPEAALEQITDLRAREDHPLLRRFHAVTLEALDRSEQAATLFHELYHRDEERAADFLNAYARHLLKTGQWRSAATIAGETTTRDPFNQEAWGYLTIAWRMLGDARECWLCDYERFVTLVEIDTPTGYPDSGAFLADLEDTLLSLHQASRQPVQQSLRQGTQTAGRLFGRPESAIAGIEQSIRRATERWVGTLPNDAAHPFLSRKPRELRFSGSWSVKLGSSGHHVNHVHHQGWISSAFYVALPPAMQASHDQAGWIRFGQPPQDLGLDLPARRVLRPQRGCLALFPSYMWHGTVPFDDDVPRLTVACDIAGS